MTFISMHAGSKSGSGSDINVKPDPDKKNHFVWLTTQLQLGKDISSQGMKKF